MADYFKVEGPRVGIELFQALSHFGVSSIFDGRSYHIEAASNGTEVADFLSRSQIPYQQSSEQEFKSASGLAALAQSRVF